MRMFEHVALITLCLPLAHASSSLPRSKYAPFSVIMASDVQHGWSGCNKMKPATNYQEGNAFTNQDYCDQTSASWRYDNYMNAIYDELKLTRKQTHLTIGANIIGDLTNGNEYDQKNAWRRKVDEIQTGWGQGNLRIWESLGNHDLKVEDHKKKFYKRLRETMVRNMRNLAVSHDYHRHGPNNGDLKNLWHDQYCGDPSSTAYAYKKGGIWFINLQLDLAAYSVRVYKNKWDEQVHGASGWFMDFLRNTNCGHVNVHDSDVKGIVLMYHYPKIHGDQLPPIDVNRRNEVLQVIRDYNGNIHPFNSKGNPAARVMAVFNGHYHGSLGRSEWDTELRGSANGGTPIFQFNTGSAQNGGFLEVNFHPQDSYFMVYAHKVAGTNTVHPLTPSSGSVASGFERACLKENGKSDCTKYFFDGTVCTVGLGSCGHEPDNGQASNQYHDFFSGRRSLVVEDSQEDETQSLGRTSSALRQILKDDGRA